MSIPNLLTSSRVHIGLVSGSKIVLAGPPNDNWFAHSFAIASDTVGFYELPDAAFATPARYLEEVFFRLSLLATPDDNARIFVFNPLLETNRFNILLILNCLGKLDAEQRYAVLSDADNFPVGYLLPTKLNVSDLGYLRLFSTFDARLDRTLMELVFLSPVSEAIVRWLKVKQITHNGFYGNVAEPLCWIASRAIDTMRNLVRTAEASGCQDDIRRQRDATNFVAVMPHHAGDVLFFCLAYNHTKTEITGIAVNRIYADIVRDISPQLAITEIHSPAINRHNEFRQGKATSEIEYFNCICEFLPAGGFYYYGRPSRNYNLSERHLLDQFAFALGRHSYQPSHLLFNAMHMPEMSGTVGSECPIKVLLHFAGGWPLKVYPEAMQERLIDLLYAREFDVTVLADTERTHQKCRFVTFLDYYRFKKLIASQHLLVGMDSFPCHYSTYVRGMPTLCLFSSTKPANSNARRTGYYRDLEVGLSCRPCYAINKCPLDGSIACKNFVSPEVVVQEIEGLLATIPNASACYTTLPDDVELKDDCFSPEAAIAISNGTRIDLSRSSAGILIACVVHPFFSLSTTLCDEFFSAVKREGIVSALRRSIRFIYRILR